MKPIHCDLVILGAGPNGLSLGAYLARAGMKVVIVERRHEAGGGLATEEVTLPGFLHNTHALYMAMVDYAPLYDDFELERSCRVAHLYPELQFCLPLSDRRSVRIYSDVERTCAAFAELSPRDATAYRDLCATADRLVDQLIAPATYVPPRPLLDHLVELQQTEIGRQLLSFSEQTPRQIVEGSFENEHVRALMLYVATHWGIAPDEPGVGYLALLYCNRASRYRLVRGGSHAVASALHRIVHQHGGSVLTSRRVARILLDEAGACGVELADGDRVLAAHGVASTLDPHQTFLGLVGEDALATDFRDRILDWKWDRYSLFGLHLALEEAPRFACAADQPSHDRSLVYVLGFETVDELLAEYGTVDRGRLDPVARFACCFPSVHDPSQAPVGRCTGVCTRFAPYQLADGNRWHDLPFKERVAAECLATLSAYAPNITAETVLWQYVSTPWDIENKNAAMKRGSIKHGRYTPFQLGYLRPNEHCSRVATPIDRLYLCGSSAYPGGLVIWGGGYLAANHIAARAGVRRWWAEPPMIRRARERGLL